MLKQNDVIARELRASFCARGMLVVSFVSSPGSGKTALLEHTLMRLREQYRVAALVGDLATDNDAVRLARAGVPVKQITTGTVCHLEAAMVPAGPRGLGDGRPRRAVRRERRQSRVPLVLQLGEEVRVVLMSVIEGEDKPLKYPTIFNTADLALITKSDLARAVEFDEAAARRNIDAVRPGLPILTVSARSGDGFGEFIGFLELRLAAVRPPRPVGA